MNAEAVGLILLAALVGYLWGIERGRKSGRTEMHQAWTRKWNAEAEKQAKILPEE